MQRVRESTGTRLLVDGHVHLHPVFDLAAALGCATRNFGEVTGTAAAGSSPGVLMLTETAGTHAFERLAEAPGSSLGRWQLRMAADERSLYARSGESELLLVAGRQVATAEGLEVLALATRRSFPDGRTLRRTVADVVGEGAVPVIPWGFGKWWLSRGRRVRDMLEGEMRHALLLGDNGCRPRFAAAPRLFRRAADHGIPVLAGSDPLPFRQQVNRIGSYGSALDLRLDRDRPAERLREHLLRMTATPPTFGRRTELTGFVSSQLRMQLLKRGAYR